MNFKSWIITETLSEQYHRIGKNGTKYWGRLGAGIVFTDGKKILLLRRAGEGDYLGHWGPPGGKAKPGEAPLDVARRESKEECGENEGQRFSSHKSQDGSHHFHTFIFAVDKPFDVKLSKEHDAEQWTPLDEVEDLKLHPKFKESWPVYLRAIKRNFPDVPSFSE